MDPPHILHPEETRTTPLPGPGSKPEPGLSTNPSSVFFLLGSRRRQRATQRTGDRDGTRRHTAENAPGDDDGQVSDNDPLPPPSSSAGASSSSVLRLVVLLSIARLSPPPVHDGNTRAGMASSLQSRAGWLVNKITFQ